MSELKAISSGEIYKIIEYEDCYRTDDLYYPKSEADKVIAEKDAEIAQLQAMLKERNKQVGELKKACNDKDDWCLHTLKELRHHKYKRCLDKAKICELDMEQWIEGSLRWQRRKNWLKRWLELAKKFKEAK